MNTNDIKYFMRCYEEQSINKAAKQLFITPQGLSKCLNHLENEFRTKLFERSSRGIKPTESGKFFYLHCNELIQKLEEIEISMQRLQERESVIKLGFSCGVLQAFSHYMIHKFNEKCKELHIVWEEGINNEIKTKLQKNEIDLAFIIGRAPVADIVEQELFSTMLYAIVYKGHPLYNEKEILITQLKEEPLITLNEKYQSYFSFIQRCQDFGFMPKIIVKTMESQLIYQLSENKVGIGIDVNIHKNASNLPNLRYIPISDSISWKIYTVYHKENKRKKEIQKIIDFFERWVTKIS